jgi:hypothetical protein
VDSTKEVLPAITVLRFCNSTEPSLQTLSWHLTSKQQDALTESWDRDYSNEQAATHAEVLALDYLLDSSQPYARPSGGCPDPVHEIKR